MSEANPLRVRLAAKSVPSADGCWLWTAGCTGDGYGAIWIGGRTMPAHRVAYEEYIGPIPSGLNLDHLCRVRNCINPAHLDPVEPLENIRRGMRGVLRTHCDAGHPLSGDNVRHIIKNGKPRRVCRACQRRHTRNSRLRRRAS